MNKTLQKNVVIISLLLVVVLSGLINLNRVPPVWWDEGWTLNVARNWVEFGHYGQFLNGVPMGSGLAASFPVVVPVALSFRLFGVGAWQGRLPSVLFTFGSLALIYFLAKRLYNRTVAWGSLFVVLLMGAVDSSHALVLGRTAMGEMPALFYLLSGYALLVMALESSVWWILPASLIWGIAVHSKAQVLPFWAASLLLPLALSLLKRSWRPAVLLAIGLAASWIFSREIARLFAMLVLDPTVPGERLQGIVEATALVTNWPNRVSALYTALTYGLPTLLGLCFAAWRSYQSLRQGNPGEPGEIGRWVLLSGAGSWFGWYTLLSVGFTRYLFPPVFLGSIFTSAFLYEITWHFNLGETLRKANASFFRQRSRETFGALLAVLLVVFSVSVTLKVLVGMASLTMPPLEQVDEYLNTSTPPGALIESYESELFFLLDRPYHYPPDQVNVQNISRMFLDQAEPFDYDPMSANPDYLVVGPYARWTHVYDGALASGNFRLVRAFPDASGYEVYARTNP